MTLLTKRDHHYHQSLVPGPKSQLCQGQLDELFSSVHLYKITSFHKLCATLCGTCPMRTRTRDHQRFGLDPDLWVLQAHPLDSDGTSQVPHRLGRY